MFTRRFFLGTGSFLVGVFFHSFFPEFHLSELLLLVPVILASFYVNSSARVIVVITLIFFSLGVIRFHTSLYLHESDTLDALISLDSPVSYQGIIHSDPIVKEQSQQVILDTHSFDLGYGKVDIDTRILVSTDPFTELEFGEFVEVKGVLVFPDSFVTDQERIFRYDNYLAKDKIHTQISFAQVEVLDREKPLPLHQQGIAYLYRVKNKLIEHMNHALPQPEAGLLAGLLFGKRGALDQEMSDVFRDVGLTHIVVLSGYNISLVIQLCMSLLVFLPIKLRSVLAVFAIVSFALLVGAGPTVIRASVMALFLVLSGIVGRKYDVSRALIIAGTLMVVWNPWLLFYDLSFQLSFLATYSLLTISPLFEYWFRSIPQIFQLRESAVASCSAQLLVTPLILYSIGEFSLFSPLVNSLTLFAVPWAMFFGFLVSLGTLSELFGVLAYLPLHYIIVIAEIFSKVPISVVTVPPFSRWVLFSSYLCLFLWLYVQKNRMKQRRSKTVVS